MGAGVGGRQVQESWEGLWRQIATGKSWCEEESKTIWEEECHGDDLSLTRTIYETDV